MASARILDPVVWAMRFRVKVSLWSFASATGFVAVLLGWPWLKHTGGSDGGGDAGGGSIGIWRLLREICDRLGMFLVVAMGIWEVVVGFDTVSGTQR